MPTPTPAPAFVVTRAYRGSAHVFEVYIEPARICFIRVGAGPGAEFATAASGGVLGALVAWWFSAQRKTKAQREIEKNRSRTIDQMLADHKANHAIALSDMTDVSLEPGNWAMKKGTVIWAFQLPGEKKREMCAFPTPADLAAAMDVLPRVFPAIRIDVQLDPKSGKYLRKPS